MTLDSRVNRLSPGLTARERVVLYARAVLEDQRLDPSVGSTMPDWQVPEANRLIRAANGILHVLLPQALILQADVEALSLRFQLLMTLIAWGTERTHLRNALQLLAVVPIPQSDYDRVIREGRAGFLPLVDAIELASVIDTRTDGPTDARGYEREIKRLVKEGCVRYRGKGDTLEVEVGSIHDYLGIAFEPVPTGAWAYQPVPELEWQRHAWRADMEQSEFARIDDSGPRLPQLPLRESAEPMLYPSAGDTVREALAAQVRSDTTDCWARLLAIETVRQEVVERFDDDRVIPESMDTLLGHARRRLTDLRDQAAGVFEFPPVSGPHEALMDQLRRGLVRDETQRW